MTAPALPTDHRRLTWTAIVFLLITATTVAVCLTDAFSQPDYASFAQPANSFRCLVGAELFFLLFIWPLFVFGKQDPGRHFVQTLFLGVLSLPLLAATVAVADASAWQVVRTHALLGCVVLAVVAFARVDLARWYYLGATALAGGVPLAAYFIYDVLDAKIPWLSALSPFWAMDRAAVLDGPWPLPMMILLSAVAAAVWLVKPSGE